MRFLFFSFRVVTNSVGKRSKGRAAVQIHRYAVPKRWDMGAKGGTKEGGDDG